MLEDISLAAALHGCGVEGAPLPVGGEEWATLRGGGEECATLRGGGEECATLRGGGEECAPLLGGGACAGNDEFKLCNKCVSNCRPLSFSICTHGKYGQFCYKNYI